MLLIGDSWATFLLLDGSINDSFEKWGHSNYTFVSSIPVAILGAETDDLLEPGTQIDIQDLIDNNPSIDHVHLSIGGNDMLGDWHSSFTAADEDSLVAEIMGRMVQIVDFLHSTRPGMKVFWSGYVYPNFNEVLDDFIIPTSHPFYSNWDDMGQPSFAALNGVLNDLTTSMQAYTDSTANVDMVAAQALMQYHYGQVQPLGVPPGGTYPPFWQPLPLGDPSYPSPMGSMRDHGFALDCFHLSPEAYALMTDHQTRKFYHKALMDDAYLLSAGNGQDGSVSDMGTVNTTLELGNSNGEDFAIMLTFNTTILAPFTLEKASIFLRRESVAGSDPALGELSLSINSGAFGISLNVEAVDLTAPASATGEPCVFGSAGGTGHWIRIQIPDAMLWAISNLAETQIRIISADAQIGDLVSFSPSDDPEFAPVLNLKYGTIPTNVSAQGSEQHFTLYPNPADDRLHLDMGVSVIERVRIFNSLGEVCLDAFGTTIDVSALARGIYLLRADSGNSTWVQTFIKN